MGFGPVYGRLDPQNRRFPARRPAGFENQTIPFQGPRGPLKGPRGPFKGPRGPFKGPRGPFKGPRVPLKGPRGPFKGSRGGPRGPLKGPRGPLKGPRGPLQTYLTLKLFDSCGSPPGTDSEGHRCDDRRFKKVCLPSSLSIGSCQRGV